MHKCHPNNFFVTLIKMIFLLQLFNTDCTNKALHSRDNGRAAKSLGHISTDI